MAKDSKSDIDPRFDPAFQRGFDPSIPIEEYVPPRQPRRVPAPTVIDVPATAPAAPAAPAAPTPSPPTAAPAAPSPAAEVPAAAPDAEQATDVEATDDLAVADAEPSSVRNPFLLFLGIIAVALIAVGVWLFVRSGEAFNSKEVRSQGDYMSLAATINMAPFIALLGAATAIGVLFVFAARWRRRH
jgi:hypothetical protein